MAAECSVEWPLDESLECAEDAQPFECMAVEYLWNWTGRRYGLTTLDVRPTAHTYATPSTFYDSPAMPVLGASGSLVTCCSRHQRMPCMCERLTSIVLPAPVASIESVEIEGEVLEPSAYTVFDGRYLSRIDGGEWPRLQDFSAPLGSPDTWRVVLQQGVEVPAGGRLAAAVLACELAKAARGSSSCQLPQRLQSITRQGITMAVLDPFEGLESGRTGIWIIDSWISSVMKAPRGGSVRSVDVKPSSRR